MTLRRSDGGHTFDGSALLAYCETCGNGHQSPVFAESLDRPILSKAEDCEATLPVWQRAFCPGGDDFICDDCRSQLGPLLALSGTYQLSLPLTAWAR